MGNAKSCAAKFVHSKDVKKRLMLPSFSQDHTRNSTMKKLRDFVTALTPSKNNSPVNFSSVETDSDSESDEESVNNENMAEYEYNLKLSAINITHKHV